jgi:bacteriophage N4 adsorption protein B
MTALFAIWALISGLDDLVIDLALLYCRLLRWFKAGQPPSPEQLDSVPPKQIAIFVPLWREHNVLRNMIQHNVRTQRFGWPHFFLGIYPNDHQTLKVARQLAERFPNVHISLCPHGGPTSKADNLNHIYDAMTRFESARRGRFDVVITHDAEDLIHPDALRWVNYYIDRYDMVQIPVLPLPTPAPELLHGVYCDEFADYQSRELPARQLLGGFLPSCGVGAGFSRKSLESLAAAHGDQLFEPKCLTEDYESGFRLHRLGCPQLFVPIAGAGGEPVATRAYFPRTFRAAVKQRTRWVMGIALQSWELHGWSDTMSQFYWFWRDRKGLVSAVAGPAANAVFLYGAAGWYADGMAGRVSKLFLDSSTAWIADVFTFSMALQALHLGLRMRFSAQIYGWRFASAAPIRLAVGAAINFLATTCAVHRYFRARWAGQPHAWLKTEHHYPTAETLAPAKSRAARAG